MRFRSLFVLCLVVLAGCGAKTIDATNADSFERSFKAVIADMAEAERVAFSGAILTLVNDATKKTILPVHIVQGKEAEILLNPEFRAAFASELVQTVGQVVDGKSAEEISALAAAVAQKAGANALVQLRDRLKALERSVAEAAEKVEAKKAEKAAFLQRLDQQTALLDRVEVRVVKSSLSNFQQYRAGGDFELEVVNRNEQAVLDARIHLVWKAKDHTGWPKSLRLKAQKAVGEKGLAPNASVKLTAKDVVLAFASVRGGLESPEQLTFSGLADEVRPAGGETVYRVVLEKERERLASFDYRIAKAERELQRLEAELQETKTEIAARS